jgi:RNA polymerase-interacting CarD/CdnL/TRCF family regulator
MLYRSREGKLTTSEQRLLETARTYFVEEVSAVLKLGADEVRNDLDALGQSGDASD